MTSTTRMTTRFTRTALAAVAGIAVLGLSAGPGAGTAQAIVSFDWATVDQDLGNTGEVQPQGTFGSVDYAYRISKHETTNAQYAEFLNAVDMTGANGLGLYNGNMAGGFGGITLNGANANGSKYEVNAGRGNNPVVYVDFYDTLRFSNWLHNGQGAGNTEDGAYTLLGGTAVPTNGNSITRNPLADIFLTSEDEWYKAAYYDPALNGGLGGYFNYATSSDTPPTAEAPAGGTNSANYATVVGNTTAVGAYMGSVSPLGTFDQSGNVFEWNEALISGSFRVFRGGTWLFFADNLPASIRRFDVPSVENIIVGFRVASRVATDPPSGGAAPEPATMFLSALAGAAVLGCCQRRRA